MTERRRKTRKKTLGHGDLFHVYIASDTPPEVCEFLSRLKQRGDFSYEVLQIIEQYVHGLQGAPASQGAPAEHGTPSQAAGTQDAQVQPGAPVAAAGGTDGSTQPADAARHEVGKSASRVTPAPQQQIVAHEKAEVESRATEPAVEPEPVKVEKAVPKIDPIALLRQQRKAWVASSSNGS
ncbi:hypothetical protein [Alicyclobacillus dauci]|uniref:Uncharacterized protein n=1 Tax=Alicyclobacillus dauci TaxID=1475485 RepID=A0ABY6Z4J1_9BACL|nr:hypothetical protein [Alicyclobacillus dauci]WAH36920.1 hypothetical protein NZD86_22620 [Alicyclobacillus dauci]